MHTSRAPNICMPAHANCWFQHFVKSAHWLCRGYEFSPLFTLRATHNRGIVSPCPSLTPDKPAWFRCHSTWLHFNCMREQLRNVDCVQPPLNQAKEQLHAQVLVDPLWKPTEQWPSSSTHSFTCLLSLQLRWVEVTFPNSPNSNA